MSVTDSVQNFWRTFCAEHPEINPETPFQTWHFGLGREDARELCDLVLQGKKTGTASLPWEYEDKPEDAPVLGGYSVVTDFDGAPQCVIQTTDIRVIPFDEVDAEFAASEGEGDLSLEYWRRVHWDYFSRRCAALGKEPSEKMPVNCERFKLLYP